MAVKSLKRSTVKSVGTTDNSMAAGYSFQDFQHLETISIDNYTASASFINLDKYIGEYKHLQIRGTARVQRPTYQNMYLRIRFNNDSTASYWSHLFYGTGTTAASAGGGDFETFGNIGWITSDNAPSQQFGGFVTDVLDAFSSTKYKNTRSAVGVAGGNEPRTNFNSSLWSNTASINTITIFAESGNLVPGSRLSLYGIR